MSDCELIETCHLTIEYERIGVRVKKNLGLTSPVLVNALTGVMHAEVHGIGGARAVCDPPMMVDVGQTRARISSMSAINLRACRNCERMLKAASGDRIAESICHEQLADGIRADQRNGERDGNGVRIKDGGI